MDYKNKNHMSYSLLGFSWWSRVTNECFQGGAFWDISWFSGIEMQLPGQRSSSLTKQALPTKIPGCFAQAAHETWPDIREEVLQGTGRASLIPHLGGTLLAVCVQDSCQKLRHNTQTALLKWTQLGVNEGKFLITELIAQSAKAICWYSSSLN